MKRILIFVGFVDLGETVPGTLRIVSLCILFKACRRSRSRSARHFTSISVQPYTALSHASHAGHLLVESHVSYFTVRRRVLRWNLTADGSTTAQVLKGLRQFGGHIMVNQNRGSPSRLVQARVHSPPAISQMRSLFRPTVTPLLKPSLAFDPGRLKRFQPSKSVT
jgi:hypothetical protein